MTITVTTGDIQNGKRYDPVRCPVARALRRAGMTYFTVMESAVRLRDEERHGGLLVLPVPVQEWIRCFDRGEPVRPISFELEALWISPRGFRPQTVDYRAPQDKVGETGETELPPILPSAERDSLEPIEETACAV